MHIFNQRSQLLVIKRLEIGNEVTRCRHVLFGLGVKTRMDRIIRPLEQSVLAILYQLHAVITILPGSTAGNA